MDLTVVVISLLALIGVLLVGAAILCCVCYFTGTKEQEEDEAEEKAKKEALAQSIRPGKSPALQPGRSRPVFATGAQTMGSMLQRSATDTDVILATATSAIPLKELGGKNNDVLVDISQQLVFDENEAHKEERQCIVCRTRKEITWSQLSCYAQTVIGVLVYKRAPTQPLPALAALNRAKTLSTTTLAPEPDSRLDSSSSSRAQPKQQPQLSRTTTRPKSPRSPAKSPSQRGPKQEQQQQQRTREQRLQSPQAGAS